MKYKGVFPAGKKRAEAKQTKAPKILFGKRDRAQVSLSRISVIDPFSTKYGNKILEDRISNWLMAWVASYNSREKVLNKHLSKDTDPKSLNIIKVFETTTLKV